MIALFFWLALVQGSPDDGCLTLQKYSQSMADFPLAGLTLLDPESLQQVATLVQIDLTERPARIEITPAQSDPWKLCLRREDLEKLIVYEVRTVEHDYDGTTCVSYDEGRPHAALFQRIEHNQAREASLYPYAQQKLGWQRIPSGAGFFREAIRFACGIEVGDRDLVALLEGSGDSLDGLQMIRGDSPLAAEESFTRESELELFGTRYLLGRGIPLSREP